jgi:benzoylformate decarboxylase
MATVREETYQLLRSLGMTTVFGNPGSTEEPFLADFPDDFTYVLALQEASAVAAADGYAQATGKAAFVNLHTSPGMGNAMGSIIAAQYNKAPLVITAGQQVRASMALEPLLYNRDAVQLPQPHVKWSYEVVRPQDVPRVLARAYDIAMQAPMGPVFVSIPMDDWDAEAEPYEVRRVSHRVAPDPNALKCVGDALTSAKAPALVCGAGVDRSGAWGDVVTLAEKTRAAVWSAPWSGRAGFPEDHPQFQGMLPFAEKMLAEKLAPYDVVVALGAPAFLYSPYVPGTVVESGTHLFQITDDPDEAARAAGGDSVVGDVALAVTSLLAQVPASDRVIPRPTEPPPVPESKTPMTPAFVMHTLAQVLPSNAVVTQESPSNAKSQHMYLKATQPGGYYAGASGGLGWSLPASVGLQMADRARPVVVVIGDGSVHYSVKSLYTMAQHKLPIVTVVLRNSEYAILKAFGEFEHVTGLPGMDLPALDIVSIAQGYGCVGLRVETPEVLAGALRDALASRVPTVLEVLISPEVPPLL